MSIDPLNPTEPVSSSGDGSATIPAPTLGQSLLVPETVLPGESAPVEVPQTLVQPGNGIASPSSASKVRPALPALPGYQLLRELGRGGMGVVYHARDPRLHREVAIKMLLVGAHAGPMERVRFQIEAETVAGLQHPNIIKIHDVGEWEGCPYLVLEFLEGQGLERRLRDHPPSPQEAAAMIETLARAMFCAHQRGIVHRDLKPGNVFVAPDGHLRILDFGLAKRLEGDSHTRSGLIMGTPAYMAPEQAHGEVRTIGPAADIYALGAILYEMLVGRPPFQANSVMDTLIQVRRDDPVPPSRLTPRLPRDLEVICLKCLRKDPSARYASAEALADDLHRFLVGEPILARPVPSWERVYKWTRRHPSIAALIAVCTVALLTLVGTGVWYSARLQHFNTQLKKTNQKLEAAQSRTRTAVDEMYTQVAEKWLDEEPYQDPLQRAFLEKALRYYEEMSQEEGTNPELRRATALASFRTGQIYRALGRNADAEKAYDQAIRLQEGLVKDLPAEPAVRQDLANSLNYRGELLRTTGRAADAGPWYDRALELQGALVAVAERPDYRKEQARSSYNKGLALRETDHPAEALLAFSKARALLEPLVQECKDEPSYAQELARVYLNQGTVQRTLHQKQEAEDSYRLALGLQTDLARRFPRKPDYSYELAITQVNLGNLLVRAPGRGPEALEAYRTARDLLGALVVAHPLRPIYSRELANTWNSLAATLVQSDAGEAEKAWEEAARLFEGLSAQWPDAPDYHLGAGKAWTNLALLSLRAPAQPEKALLRLRNAIAHLERAGPSGAYPAEVRQELGVAYESLAKAAVQVSDHAGAAAAIEKFLSYGSGSNRDRYLAARLLARAYACSEADGSGGEAARKERGDRYAGRCLELLRQVDFAQLNPVPDPRDRAAAFAPLAGRPEFAALIASWK